jgi:hypothetical protein
MIRKNERPSLAAMASIYKTIDFQVGNNKQIYGVRKALAEINYSIDKLAEEMRLIRLHGGRHDVQ